MPDPWEYPWYAAWDLAFHCVALAHLDAEFAKRQLDPPVPGVVHAPERPAPRLRVEFQRREPSGARLGRAAGLRDRCKAEASGATALGPRVPRARSSTSSCSTSPGGSTARTRRATTSSKGVSSGSTTSASSTARSRSRRRARLEQSDGTAWMAMYCLNLLEMALESSRPTTRSTRMSPPSSSSTSSTSPPPWRARGCWDDEDGWFYDVVGSETGAAAAGQGALDRRRGRPVCRHRTGSRGPYPFPGLCTQDELVLETSPSTPAMSPT